MYKEYPLCRRGTMKETLPGVRRGFIDCMQTTLNDKNVTKCDKCQNSGIFVTIIWNARESREMLINKYKHA